MKTSPFPSAARMPRGGYSFFLIPAAFILVLAAGISRAGEAMVSFSWERLPGYAEERNGEALELRDELVAAHQSYLAALEKAIGHATRISPSEPGAALAWARVEYLLEVCFDLIGDTGEHALFLKVTERLSEAGIRPGAPAAAVSLDGDAPDAGDDGGGGLSFEDAGGNRLLPVRLGDEIALVYADSAERVPAGRDVFAHPMQESTADPASPASLAAARAAWLRATVFERLGKADEAERETLGLGLIRDWMTLGPFEGDGVEALDVPLGPEADLLNMEPGAMYAGRSGPVSWRPARSSDPLGRLFFQSHFRSGRGAAAFALALVRSPGDRPAVLRFGSDGPCAVWVNRTRARQARNSGSADPDQGAFDVWLRRGWNMVLVKSLAPSGNWRFSARMTDPGGAAFPLFAARLDGESRERAISFASRAARRSVLDRFYLPAREVDFGGLSTLAVHLGTNPGDARANFYLGALLWRRGLAMGESRFDRELIFRRAIELSGDNAYFILAAARAAESGADGPARALNLRRTLLEAAADRGSSAALTDLGRMYLDELRQPRRAGECAANALAANPLSLGAGVLEFDVASARGWRPLADEILAGLIRRHPDAAEVRLRAGRRHLEEREYARAVVEMHELLELDAGNREALRGAVASLCRLGQPQAAIDLLGRRLAAFPHDSESRLDLAGLYTSLGRSDEALNLLDEALAAAPDDLEALAMRPKAARGVVLPPPSSGEREAEPRQALDLSRPASIPPEGWEYLFFQVDDRLAGDNSLSRTVSFAARIYSETAGQDMRRLEAWLEREIGNAVATRVEILGPGSERARLSPPPGGPDGRSAYRLPPLAAGSVVEIEASVVLPPPAFPGKYFGHAVPLARRAPVRLGRYMFTASRERRFFFHRTGGAPEPIILDGRGRRNVTRVWEMRDLPALSDEPFSPGKDELSPAVQISSFGDWNDFAAWYWRLVDDQCQAPPELRVLSRNLARPGEPPLQSLERAAGWIAANLSHRDLGDGPGAFRPAEARAILDGRSADCVDRTLLLCLFAREYGLDAWPVLTRTSGRGGGPEEAPLPLLDHFDHSLVMIPSGGGVLMDASDPHRAPTVMPPRLFGSAALAIRPDGAQAFVVPDGGGAGCSWTETSLLVVDGDGSALWEQTVGGGGMAASALRARFGREEERDAAWESFLSAAGANPTAAAAEFSDDGVDGVKFSGRSRLRSLAVSDSRRASLGVPPLPGGEDGKHFGWALPFLHQDVLETSGRERDVLMPSGFRIVRRIEIRHPPEWRLVNPPEPTEMSGSFGSVRVAAEAFPGGLRCEFSFEVPGRRIRAADFPAFRRMAVLARRWRTPVFVWEKP